jgi:predicted GNAT superfamily acetyltransferase
MMPAMAPSPTLAPERRLTVDDVWVGELGLPADFHEAAALYGETFGYTDPNLTLNPLLLTALVANGGVAVGARADDGALVGFAYGFLGQDAGGPYLYSQAAVVAPDAQGQGLGRRLKEAQRKAALGRGLTTMRWAYDPLLCRNAYFNLTVLGARGVAYRQDFYGTPGSDRMIVEWALGRPRRPAGDLVEPALLRSLEGQATGTVTGAGELLLVSVPRVMPAADDAPAERRGLRAALGPAMAHGYRAVACVPTGERSAVYVLRRCEVVR